MGSLTCKSMVFAIAPIIRIGNLIPHFAHSNEPWRLGSVHLLWRRGQHDAFVFCKVLL